MDVSAQEELLQSATSLADSGKLTEATESARKAALELKQKLETEKKNAETAKQNAKGKDALSAAAGNLSLGAEQLKQVNLIPVIAGAALAGALVTYMYVKRRRMRIRKESNKEAKKEVG